MFALVRCATEEVLESLMKATTSTIKVYSSRHLFSRRPHSGLQGIKTDFLLSWNRMATCQVSKETEIFIIAISLISQLDVDNL